MMFYIKKQVLPLKWKTIKLKDILNASNGVNSDTDSLTDWQEVNTKLLKWNDDGSFELPTCKEVISRFEYIETLLSFARWIVTSYEKPLSNILERKVLPILSDPTEDDSDGDLDSDDIDPHPLKYRLNDCFIENISQLEDLAYAYNDNSTDWLMKYSINKEHWLSFMFIRSFADGKNGTSDYVNSANWSVVGGEIDNQFANYVYNNNSKLYDFFKNTDSIYANESGDLIDLRHMAATATVYIYKSDLLDSQYFNYSDYHEWYNIVKNIRVFSKNAFTVAKTEMFEYNFDNLGGWAGDLQTLMVDTHIKVQGSTDYTTFYNTLYNSIGQDSFSMKDLYADIDAYNIYILLHEDPDVSLTETLLYYYDDGYKERYSTFTNGWDKYRISKLTYTYTKNKFMSVLHWPLFERDGISYNFTDSQSEAARDAFVQFLMERIENE